LWWLRGKEADGFFFVLGRGKQLEFCGKSMGAHHNMEWRVVAAEGPL